MYTPKEDEETRLTSGTSRARLPSHTFALAVTGVVLGVLALALSILSAGFGGKAYQLASAPVPIAPTPPTAPSGPATRVGFSANLNNGFQLSLTPAIVTHWNADAGLYDGYYNAGHFNPTTGVFTVPTTGVYSVAYHVRVQSDNWGGVSPAIVDATCALYVAGNYATQFVASEVVTTGLYADLAPGGALAMSLVAGSSITLRCAISNGSVNTFVSSGPGTVFSMELQAL